MRRVCKPMQDRELGEHLRQVSDKSDQWSQVGCGNEIVSAEQRTIYDFTDGHCSAIFVNGLGSLSGGYM